MLLAKRPNLLIIDAGLPYMSGLDFVATLLADYTAPALPILFITGRGERRAFSRRQVNDVSSTCSGRATAGRRRYGAKIDAVG